MIRHPVVRHTVTELRARRGAVGRLLAWSVPEALPTAVSGLVIAHALDDGFLAGRPLTGFAWLAGLAVAALLGALGVRQVNHVVADLVEPFRDGLVRRVVAGALSGTATGAADGAPADVPHGGRGAVSRLTHQVETVRDSYAGLVLVARGFLVTSGSALIGLTALAPALFPLVLPALLVGLAVFAVATGRAVAWQRRYLLADERLADSAGAVLGAVRDVTACRAEDRVAAAIEPTVADQARAERALARMAALRSVSVAVAGWVPLLVVLVGAGWLVRHGMTAGALVGALAYLSQALLPTLDTFTRTVGAGGLRYAVTLGRILAATPTTRPAPAPGPAPAPAPGYEIVARGLGFRYGPAADPVVEEFSLRIPEGDHLALVGPSGVGKSTLAALLCGTLTPDTGTVTLGGTPVTSLDPVALASQRVLIPQEAYVFAGSLAENLGYLAPDAPPRRLIAAVDALGAGELVVRLGGLGATLRPERLSAGQRQLIALVRAYLSPAGVVVLDEATCHLDPATEARVEAAFAARPCPADAPGGRQSRPGTLIVVAHRMSSAVRARRVLVLDGGRPVLGGHDDLLRRSRLYRDLTGYWRAGSPPDGSKPTGVGGEPHGLDPGTRPDLAVDPREMVVHGTDR